MTLAAIPRRFRSGLATDLIDELDLLADGQNYLFLGDPGSGKTTTLKRLILSLFEESAVASNDTDLAFSWCYADQAAKERLRYRRDRDLDLCEFAGAASSAHGSVRR